MLRVYTMVRSKSDTEDLAVRCMVGGCEARSEIDPLGILAGRSEDV